MHKKTEVTEIRRFGFHLALGLNIAGCIMFYREKEHFVWFILVGSLSLIFAILNPGILRSIKKVLDVFISAVRYLFNIINLAVIFYMIFFPVATLFKFLRKDILRQRIDKSSASYWIKRKDPASTVSYNRMG